MLINASVIKGYSIVATDGNIGKVSDFLFDDLNWSIQWLVVELGTWLEGRKVLLPPSVLGHLDAKRQEFSVKLTMDEVRRSPEIATHEPVSRQMESTIFDYYGWTPYWYTGFYMGDFETINGAIAAGPYLGSAADRDELKDKKSPGVPADPHLHSTEAVTGYHIHARDGEIGHVEDFLLQEADWRIHYLVVDTKNWWPGEKVLISPRSVRDISWGDQMVNLSTYRKTVKDSPTYNDSVAVDRDFENHFHRYYSEAFSSDNPRVDISHDESSRPM